MPRRVAGASADGYTLLVTTAASPSTKHYKSKGFAATDFKPVAIVASSPEALLDQPKQSGQNLAEFVNASHGRTINFGSAGVGSGSHIAAEYFFKIIAGIGRPMCPSRAARRR